MTLKGDQSTTRALNRRLILNCLRREGGLSRVEISAMTGLSPAAVTGVTAELINEGMLVEGKGMQSTGGRKPIPLNIDYRQHWSAGFKLTPDGVEGTLTDLSTQPIGTCKVPLSSYDPATVAAAVENGVATLLQMQNSNWNKLVGIGVAMPGLIDVNRGLCLEFHDFGWDHVPIAELIAARISVPVWVDNDVNAFAIAQQLFGYGRTRGSALVLVISAGVGAALIFNGQIHRGARFAAGEIGFLRHDKGNWVTSDRLSWNQRLSEPGIIRGWQELRGKGPGNDLQEAAANGDPLAVVYLGKVGREIGERLVSMIDLVDPEVVIVGGEAVRFGKALIDPLARAVKENSFGTPPPLEVDWDNDVWLRGASALAIQKFFDFESAAGYQRKLVG
ncbi:ROK family transcriptional regulator [Mesorhizobium sp. 1M-11]|uniref:ROK family transcriptional regulator n=1 Tax=Mesorhizobium sp. 1M-11 TaxID=1529006 RepID=UPI0009EA2F43|nr:ROK family transcriptional regulator [Mesorhizobium sp. 1M-11]